MSIEHDRPDDPSSEDLALALVQSHTVWCPYCGEPVDLALDAAGGAVQDYVEDCQVCCRPWSVHVTVDGLGMPTVSVATQDDG